MLFSFAPLVLTLLLGAGPELAGTRAPTRPETQVPPRPFPYVVEPPATEVRVGDPAPNFAYQGYDGRWMRLHHLVDHAHVLLLFGADEALLTQIEKERERLLGLGVIPVAIVDRRPGKARDLARRLNLRYTVLADARQVIAAQFNAVEQGRVTPSWFVVDRRGKVRGLSRGRLLAEDYPRLCARCLALPMPGTLFPTSR